MLPYFMYFLVPVAAWIAQSDGALRWAMAAGLVVTSVASVFIHAQGVLHPPATLWNLNPDDINQNPIRLWDWRHPPFLAGWIADDERTNDDPLNARGCEGPPDPPQDLRIVSDRWNMLVAAWKPSSRAVTGYTVESGGAPGRSDFPEREARDPTVTAYRVPPGKYYARVRAKNACGVSPPSNEITIIVR
jgi:fibronectin type III domain protein